MKKRLVWLVPLAVVLLVGAVLVVRNFRPPRPAPAEARAEGGQPAPDGRRATASVGDVSVRLTETGLIQPKTMVLVKSKVSGKVTRRQVEEGKLVRQGDLLATVEPDMAQARTVASLKSGYGRAKVDLERARQDYQRDLGLQKDGHISEVKLQLSKDAYDVAKIEFQSALEQMRLAEEDGVKMDEEAQAGTLLDILAPASGTVINMEIEEGEIVTSGTVSYTSGTTLMTIADLSAMQIKAGVNEVDIGKIRDGQDVAIDVDAYPGVRFHGVITHLAPAARDDQGVKIFDVEIDITDSDQRLRPNMTANIEIQGDHHEGVLTVPIETAFKKQGQYVVYVFDGSANEPVERVVVTGISNIEKVEIVSGLKEGEIVARYDPRVEGQGLSEDEQRRRRMASGRRG
jgi:HlyD family secretion protein